MAIFGPPPGALPYKQSFLQGVSQGLRDSGINEIIARSVAQKRAQAFQSDEAGKARAHVVSEGRKDRDLKRAEFEHTKGMSTLDMFGQVADDVQKNPGLAQSEFYRNFTDNNLFGVDEEGIPYGSIWTVNQDTNEYNLTTLNEVQAAEVDRTKAGTDLANAQTGNVQADTEGKLSDNEIKRLAVVTAKHDLEKNLRSNDIYDTEGNKLTGDAAFAAVSQAMQALHEKGDTSLLEQLRVDEKNPYSKQIDDIAAAFFPEDRRAAESFVKYMVVTHPRLKGGLELAVMQAQVDYYNELSQRNVDKAMSYLNPGIDPAHQSTIRATLETSSQERTVALGQVNGMKLDGDNPISGQHSMWFANPFSTSLQQALLANAKELKDADINVVPFPVTDEEMNQHVAATIYLIKKDLGIKQKKELEAKFTDIVDGVESERKLSQGQIEGLVLDSRRKMLNAMRTESIFDMASWSRPLLTERADTQLYIKLRALYGKPATPELQTMHGKQDFTTDEAFDTGVDQYGNLIDLNDANLAVDLAGPVYNKPFKPPGIESQ